MVRAIAKVTKKNHLFDDRLKGQITVISDNAVTAEEASRIFRAMLKAKKFSIVDDGDDLLRIDPASEASKEADPS